MSAALAFITSRLGLGVICGALILASVTASYQWGVTHRDLVKEEARANGLHAEIYAPAEGYRDRLTMCVSNLAGATTALSHQNAHIDALKAASDDATARAQAAVAAAQSRATTAQQRAQALLSAQPREGEARCAAADRLILEEVR